MAQHIITDHGGSVEKTDDTSDTSVGKSSNNTTRKGSSSISLEDRILIVQQALFDLRDYGVDVQRTNVSANGARVAAVVLSGLVWDDAGNLVRAK